MIQNNNIIGSDSEVEYVVNEKVPKEFVVQILKVLNAKFLLGLNILGDGLIF